MNIKTRLILIVALFGTSAVVLALVLAQCTQQTAPTAITPSSPGTSPTTESVTVVSTTEDTDAGERGDQDDEPTVVVSLPRDAYERVAGVEALHTTEYGSVVWLELTQSDFEELQAAEVEFEVRDATVINFGGYSFDPRMGEPPLPVELTSSYDSDTHGLYLIQLYGPPKDEWFAKLETEGVESLGYIGAETYRVRMMSSQVAKVEGFDFVRSVALYHSAYRISPSLLEYAATFESGMVENVAVTIYDNGQASGTMDRTVEAIEALGGTLLDQSPDYTHPVVHTTFVLPASAITPTARLNDVLWLEGSLPEFIPEDEMSAQIIAGNGVAVGHKTWLQVQQVGALITTRQAASRLETALYPENNTQNPVRPLPRLILYQDGDLFREISHAPIMTTNPMLSFSLSNSVTQKQEVV